MIDLLITSLPRCGTRWLAAALNESPEWHVAHNPPPSYIENPVSQIESPHIIDRYAAVDTRMIGTPHNHPMAKQVKKRAVILRDPMEVYRSFLQCGWGEFARAALPALSEAIANAAQFPGVHAIDFEAMTRVDGFHDYAEKLGIKMLTPPPVTLPRNASPGREFELRLSDVEWVEDNLAAYDAAWQLWAGSE